MKQKRSSSFAANTAAATGIARSVNRAEREIPNWQYDTFNFLKKYAKKHNTFMAEDVRVASEKTLPEPPNKRAWGAVILTGVKNNIITRKTYQNTTNVNAHRTPATLWKSNIFKG